MFIERKLILYIQFLPFKRGDRLYTLESDVCRRQILTYKDGAHTEGIKICTMAVDLLYNIGIQMKRKELTKTFMMISNGKKPGVPTRNTNSYKVMY